MRKIFKFVLVVALMLTSGFSFAADKITIAAAANLRYVLEELKQQYLKENKGAEIEIVFGASGTLTQQIEWS